MGNGQAVLAIDDFALVGVADRPDKDGFARTALPSGRHVPTIRAKVPANKTARHGHDLFLGGRIEVTSRDVQALQSILVVSSPVKRASIKQAVADSLIALKQ